MKENRLLRFWNCIYPFLVFFVMANFSTYLVMSLSPKWDPMIVQTIVQIIVIMMMVFWMKKREKVKHGKIQPFRQDLIAIFLVIIISALFSMVLNQLIDASNLKELSPTYQLVSDSLYQPGKIQIILCVGLIAPVFEEFIYRGVLFGQMRKTYSFLFSAVISALIFGGLHLNLVQFVYALAMGYLFAFFFEKGGSVWFAIIAHIAANLTSLITTWMGSASWLFEHGKMSLLLALIEGILGILLINCFKKRIELLKKS